MKIETVRVLGQGSYGLVSLVKVTTLPWIERYYAKKISFLKAAANLEKELRILNHFHGCLNIVQCLSRRLQFRNIGGVRVCNLYLEYASGGTLSDLIENNGGRLPESDIRRYTRMILRGLAVLHGEDYVHCDLKPCNILAFPSRTHGNGWDLKISDFGLAKEPHEGCVVVTSKCRGTPPYMSPESIGPRGLIGTPLDIWSLGCVVLEMFGDSPMDEEPILWWNVPEHISATGKDFVRRCMAMDPSDRWSANRLMSHPFVAEGEVPRTLPYQNPSLQCDGGMEDSDDSLYRLCNGWVEELIR